MRRRNFLKTTLATATSLGAAGTLPQAMAVPDSKARELRAEVAIIGGGLGGCAAALAALRRGRFGQKCGACEKFHAS